jgi:hypothetical protein
MHKSSKEARMTQPWNFWYHVGGNTKSTWLHGDRRGFRTRHHREHIEGDYRHPPPRGMCDQESRIARASESPPVILDREQCLVMCPLVRKKRPYTRNKPRRNAKAHDAGPPGMQAAS